MDSIESKINNLTNAWQQFYLNVGVQDAWRAILDMATNLLNSLNTLPKMFGKFPAVALGIVQSTILLIRTLIRNAMQGVAAIFTQAGSEAGNNFANSALGPIRRIRDEIETIRLGHMIGRGNLSKQ